LARPALLRIDAPGVALTLAHRAVDVIEAPRDYNAMRADLWFKRVRRDRRR
jgi:hypothetical protein